MGENLDNPLNFYMNTQNLQQSEFLPEIPSYNSQDDEQMEINNEFPHKEDINEAQKQIKEEEDKLESFLDNEIENTIFSKPIVSKMNANNIHQGESKANEFKNQKESEQKIEASEKKKNQKESEQRMEDSEKKAELQENFNTNDK